MTSSRIRVGILGGAGTLGSSIAFCLAAQDSLEEVVLIDVRQNMLRSHVMDLEQAIAPISSTSITSGSYEDLERCTVVVVAASVSELNSTDRLTFLRANIPLVEKVSAHIRSICPEAIVVNATNPVDILTFMIWRLTGLPKRRVIGFSLNDSTRFRWAIGKILKVAVGRIKALVVGEHGPSQVLLFSTISVDGERIVLSSEHRAAVSELVHSWFGTYTSLKSGRTSGWTSAVSALRVINGIAGGSEEPLALSVIPDGEYGLRDLCLSLPVRLCRSGVESIVSLALADDEAAALRASATKIRDLIKRTNGTD